MRVLVACEYSGRVRDAFLRAGHDAWSCDLLPTDRPGPHYQGDVRHILSEPWDLMISHPSCQYLCGSGLHWNKRVGHVRYGGHETASALEFVRLLMGQKHIRLKALENPVGLIGTAIRPADQFIQPHQFGADASKATGLWLDGLPLLKPTLHIPGRVVEWPRGSGKMVRRWANQTDSGNNKLAPSADRWKIRSETYQGIADAMADQWGAL